jgi:hypothetical protein
VSFAGQGGVLDTIELRHNTSDRAIAAVNTTSIINSVIKENIFTTRVAQDVCELTGVNVDYNLWSTGMRCGPHDVTANPAFVTGQGLHLTAGSPGIDQGDPQEGSGSDIDGDCRPQGRAPDIGADEYRPP